jgi:radical SAM superfamily enzyme YgiQ (UPF0313 family)
MSGGGGFDRGERPRIVLVSTYDLGRQPFGLASPARWLRDAGFDVRCLDLAIERADDVVFRETAAVALFLPMHTATRLATQLIPRIRAANPRARIWCYGLYAPMNETMLRRIGADEIVGGEFEPRLVEWAEALRADASGGAAGAPVNAAVATSDSRSIVLDRLSFRTPDRSDLPALDRYARVCMPDGSTRRVGATEASRGCKHLCRHCPVVPVYGGRFRVVARDVVLEDVARLVDAGAEHITFGDPDFWNGIGHAIPLVRELHARFPSVSYDVTIKIEHLLAQSEHLATLRDTGCLFVTSAVESLEDDVLARLDKGHTHADFVEALRRCARAGVALQPTFIPFTPWTTTASYRRFLDELSGLGLEETIAPIQLGIRLLIPAGSRLLELEEIRERIGPFDEQALVHPWVHADPDVDALARDVFATVQQSARHGDGHAAAFDRVWDLVAARTDAPDSGPLGFHRRAKRTPVPYLTEPWYC